MKLCINCEHYRPALITAPGMNNNAQCHHPRFVSMVTGKPETRICRIQRETSLQDYCGPDARFFEPAKCERCDSPAVEGEELCDACEQSRAEARYERSQEEGFRGAETAAFQATQQALARALK